MTRPSIRLPAGKSLAFDFPDAGPHKWIATNLVAPLLDRPAQQDPVTSSDLGRPCSGARANAQPHQQSSRKPDHLWFPLLVACNAFGDRTESKSSPAKNSLDPSTTVSGY